MLTGSVGSLDIPVGEDGETTLGELQAAPGDLETDVVEEVNRKELKAALWGAVDTLEADQRRAVAGTGTGSEMSWSGRGLGSRRKKPGV